VPSIAPPPAIRGYSLSQRARKRVEEIFRKLKTVDGLQKTRHRGVRRVGRLFTSATGPAIWSASGTWWGSSDETGSGVRRRWVRGRKRHQLLEHPGPKARGRKSYAISTGYGFNHDWLPSIEKTSVGKLSKYWSRTSVPPCLNAEIFAYVHTWIISKLQSESPQTDLARLLVACSLLREDNLWFGLILCGREEMGR